MKTVSSCTLANDQSVFKSESRISEFYRFDLYYRCCKSETPESLPPLVHYKILQWQPRFWTIPIWVRSAHFSSVSWNNLVFSFETSHGSRHDESGEVRNVGSEHESLTVRGSYSYVGPDGVTYTVHYVADQNGFQPQGKHLPPSAGVKKLGMPLCSAAQATLCGGGVG